MHNSDYSSYSWGFWFKSLDASELRELKNRWIRAYRRSSGHERDVMGWNLRMVLTEILKRRITEINDKPVSV